MGSFTLVQNTLFCLVPYRSIVIRIGSDVNIYRQFHDYIFVRLTSVGLTVCARDLRARIHIKFIRYIFYLPTAV